MHFKETTVIDRDQVRTLGVFFIDRGGIDEEKRRGGRGEMGGREKKDVFCERVLANEERKKIFSLTSFFFPLPRFRAASSATVLQVIISSSGSKEEKAQSSRDGAILELFLILFYNKFFPFFFPSSLPYPSLALSFFLFQQQQLPPLHSGNSLGLSSLS